YVTQGSCDRGSCSYDYANGAECDDGDACTTGDSCSMGACSGTQMACNTPDPASCINATTLRTYGSPGSCSAGKGSYPHADTSRPGGCTASTCSVNAWKDVTTTGAPSARHNHTAVWTGSQMIVWGGWDGSYELKTGARYSPTTDSWTDLPTTGAP